MAYTAGQKIRVSYFNTPLASSQDALTTDGTTTTLLPTFTNSLTTTGIMGVAFTAPPSGKVTVTFSCGQGRTSAAGGVVVVDCEVRTGTTVGSGTVQRPSNNPTAEVGESTSSNQNNALTGFATVTGLTAGASYNACITYCTTGGTATFNRRQIAVRAEQ